MHFSNKKERSSARLICPDFIHSDYSHFLFFLLYEYPTPYTTLDNILKTGEITPITRNSAHCYYIYRDQAIGFEYNLAKAFADYLGVELKVKIAEKWEEMIPNIMDKSCAT